MVVLGGWALVRGLLGNPGRYVVTGSYIVAVTGSRKIYRYPRMMPQVEKRVGHVGSITEL